MKTIKLESIQIKFCREQRLRKILPAKFGITATILTCAADAPVGEKTDEDKAVELAIKHPSSLL